MKHKVSMSLLAGSMLAGGFQVHAQVNNANNMSQSVKEKQSLNIEDLKKLVPYDTQAYRAPWSRDGRESFFIDKDTKERINVELEKGTLLDYVSPWERPQYYNDRIIMTGVPIGEHGPEKGRSVMVVKDEAGEVEIKEYDFEIVCYDEAEHKYVVRAEEEDADNIFYILNQNMERETVIPQPAESEDAKYLTKVYNLNTIVYSGKKNDKQFQVQKYDMKTKTWHHVAELLPKDVYEGYEGYAEISYNTAYPEWATFSVGMLWQPKDRDDAFDDNVEIIRGEEGYVVHADGEEISFDLDLVDGKGRMVDEGEKDFVISSEEWQMPTDLFEVDEAAEKEMREKFEQEGKARMEEALANGTLKKIDKMYYVNLTTGEVRTSDLENIGQSQVVSMPGMSTSILYNEDKIAIVELHPDGERIIKEIPMADVLPDGGRYMTTVVQYTDEDITFWTLSGLVKHTFATGQSEYLAEANVI